MLMSKRTMDQVWSWDHCFNAMALAYGNPELAWDQFMVVADRQDVYGAFPDAMNDVSMHFNFSKPPVHGWALRFLRQRQPRFVNRPRRAVAYEWLSNWTDWWLTHRRWPGDALPHYLHGNDSGWDNSTMFDCGVPLVAPDLAALLVLQTEELADLATTLRCPKDARRWQRLSAGLLDSLLTELWDGERFIARKQPEGLVVESASLIPNVPIVLGHRLPEAIRTKIVARIPDYLTPWGLATEPPTSPKYEADGYWRGPVWAPPTLLIVDGLARIGERRLAREIARRFCRSCAESGFAENFDALTGAGLRDRAYTWTASVFLVLAHEFLREP
jgi:glycogen debranching enzyme